MSIDTKIDTKTAPRLPAELVASNVFLLKRLGFAAKGRSLEVYEQEGLNPYHYAILALLDEGMPETQAAIADALGYDRGTLVGLLDELEEQKLVERKRDPDDRRRHLSASPPTAGARSGGCGRLRPGSRKSSSLRSTLSSGSRCTHFCSSSPSATSRAALHLPSATRGRDGGRIDSLATPLLTSVEPLHRAGGHIREERT